MASLQGVYERREVSRLYKVFMKDARYCVSTGYDERRKVLRLYKVFIFRREVSRLYKVFIYRREVSRLYKVFMIDARYRVSTRCL